MSSHAEARELLSRFPLVDGHNDLAWIAAGGLAAQFWSVFVPATLQGDAAVAATLEQVDLVRRMIRRYPDVLELALTAADVDRIFAAGKVASLIGAEGGHSIASSMGVLRVLYGIG